MTEEEKAAARADREARAAARKRERDRKAREAALAAAQPAQEAQPDQVEMTATPGRQARSLTSPPCRRPSAMTSPLVEPDPAAFTPHPRVCGGPGGGAGARPGAGDPCLHSRRPRAGGE